MTVVLFSLSRRVLYRSTGGVGIEQFMEAFRDIGAAFAAPSSFCGKPVEHAAACGGADGDDDVLGDDNENDEAFRAVLNAAVGLRDS